MSIEQGNSQETPKFVKIPARLVVHGADTCPACKHGYVDRHYVADEVGFRDNCDTCGFEGLNITAMVLPDGSLTWDY